MKLLLDTHFALWFATDPEKLTAVERSLIDNNDLSVSAVSIWELRLKWQRRHASGERKGPIDPLKLLDVLRGRDVAIIALTPDQSAAPLLPPLAHRDPFDELLLTQAQQGGYRLLTRDAALASHPVALVAA